MEHEMDAYGITKKYDAEGAKHLYGYSNYSLNGMLGGANYALVLLMGVKASATDKEYETICEELGLITEWRDTVYKYALDHKCTVAAVSATELCAALNEYGFMHQSAAEPRA